jgi:hypothetical protein
MSWNYRVMRRVDPDGTDWFAIHEVYYDAAGNPDGYTENPVDVSGDSLEGLSWVLDRMREALNKPILDEEECGKCVLP